MNRGQNNGQGHDERRAPARPRSAPQNANPRVDNAPTRVQQAPVAPKAPKQGKKINKGVVAKVAILNILKMAFVMMCVFAIIGSIVGVQLIQYVVEATENDDALLDLETYSVAQTSYFMVYNPENPNAREEGDYIEYQELVGDEDRIWVSLDQVPDHLAQAIIATEDRDFENHNGVNLYRTFAALVNEVIPIPGMVGGASTITQQLVKNITQENEVMGLDGDPTEGYLRKLREIFRAWGLENRYSKDLILESYLNTIGLSERIAGVGAGALRYFGKEVQDLTLAESAVIAGITRAPTYYSPIQNPENSLERRNDVLWFMYEEGYISEQEMLDAQAEPLGLVDESELQDEQQADIGGVFSYASDKAYEDVIDDLMEQYGYTYSAAMNYLYNGGLRVYLTIDLNVQNALDDIMENGYDPENGYFMNSAMFPGYENAMTIQEEILNAQGQVVGTQEVLPQAAVAVVNYDGELIATSGGIGEKEASLSLNRSMGTVVYDEEGNPYVQGTVRQVGSTMKPIAAYALGIDSGIINYSKMVMDSAVSPSDPYNPQVDPETGSVINDWPSNYGITRDERIPIVSAIAESTNTVAVQVGMWVGIEQMFEFLQDTLGITSLVDPNDMDLAPLVLGSQTYGMSAYELAGAYTMFGGTETYGVHNTLHSYTRVEDARGNIVLQPELTPTQAIDPQTGYVMNRLLTNVVNYGTYPGGASPTAGGMVPTHPDGTMEAAGKTGTTSDDNDRWFVGLTPYYVTAVWWGYDQEHTLYNRWSPAASTNIPVNVWKSLMEEVQAELPIETFPEMPEGVQVATFCTASGNLAQAGCPGTMQGYYTSFGMPEPCAGHEGEVATEEPAA